MRKPGDFEGAFGATTRAGSTCVFAGGCGMPLFCVPLDGVEACLAGEACMMERIRLLALPPTAFCFPTVFLPPGGLPLRSEVPTSGHHHWTLEVELQRMLLALVVALLVVALLQ